MVNNKSPSTTPYTNYGTTDELLSQQGPQGSSSPSPSVLTGVVIPEDDAAPTTSPTTKSELTAVMDHLRRSIASAKKMTCRQVIAVIICVLGCVFAGTAQLLTMNLWIGAFPNGAGINRPFTILTMSSTINAILYSVGFTGWVVVKRPHLKFLLSGRAMWLTFLIGFSIALNGVLIVSATPHVPEILQAFLLSTVIIWTFVFVKVMFGEKRSYMSPLVAGSFLLSLGGIVAGSASQFAGVGLTASTAVWSLIFAFSLIPGALNSVVSAKYMRYFTIGNNGVNGEGRRISTRNLEAHQELLNAEAAKVGNMSIALVGTDSGTAKFAMLTFGNISQCILMFALLPLSVIPWFGTTPNMAALGHGLAAGYKCSFNLLPGCETAPLYFVLFNLSFILSAIASMFLNYYSPAMTSMVNQLVSPVAALVLIIFPVLSVGPDNNNLAYSIIAVLLIAFGAVVYTVWEESTRNIGVEVPNRDASATSDDDDVASPVV